MLASAICIGVFYNCTQDQAWAADPYGYRVQPGDTLSEITLMFAGSHDYETVATHNHIPDPDRIYPGQRIVLQPVRPVAALAGYLQAIYEARPKDAYQRLARLSREKFSLETFVQCRNVITYYDLASIRICHEMWYQEQHILQMKLYLKEDAASWGFNLIREKYQWYVWLIDLSPTFPREDGPITWECH